MKSICLRSQARVRLSGLLAHAKCDVHVDVVKAYELILQGEEQVDLETNANFQ